MSRYGNDYGGWAPYVPVAQRRINGKRGVVKRLKKGESAQPIEISGRKIATSFWGKGWCDHVESFGDYSNRLPRGRTYARNGSICHLTIEQGKVEAFVSGSSLYQVSITISALKSAHWKQVKKACTGKIGSLMELLQGKLSEEIMSVVTNDKNGLFPRSGQISYKCNCPDWAGMCKHIAAVIYGIGARLDSQPELLFKLRGVDHEELITADTATQAITRKSGSRRTLTKESLDDVFGIEIEDTKAPSPPAKKKRVKAKRVKAKKKQPAKTKPFKPTPRNIAALRRRHGMSKTDFAEVLDVSSATVTRWENTKGALSLKQKSLDALIWVSQQEVTP